ncbi:MAG TPA: hypothetical protein PKB10_13715, partial [Tepidisphaeraceae bacterium]|nr:hypothetical protein [Tepidisphaeraceae bacterium]
VVFVLGSMSTMLVGCSTHAHSARERNQMIARNISAEGGMMVDDFDRVMLLRPVSSLSPWFLKP